MGWIRIDRVTWAERALWGALVAAAVAPVALKPSIDQVASTYVEAINRGDVDAAMAVTAAELVIHPMLGGTYRGPAETRQVLEYRAALNERWTVYSWEDTGKEIHAGIEVTNDAWSLVGERPRMTVILVVRNGRLLFEDTRSDHRGTRQALQPFISWAAEEHSGELDAVWRDGRPLQQGDAAGRLLALLREWRAAHPGVAEEPSRGQG